MSITRWVDAFRRRHGVDEIVDDVTVEQRFPEVRWIGEPRLRAAQRRAFLLAEWYRAHPEAAQAIAREEAARAERTSGPAPRVAAPSAARAPEPVRDRYDDDDFAGIERTMPVHVRRTAAGGS